MNNEEQGKKINQIIAKCWADDAFKSRLLADPAGTLKAEGVDVPAGLTVKTVENTEGIFHLVIPAKPTDLSDEDLDKVAGGFLTDGMPMFTESLPRSPGSLFTQSL